LALYNFSLATSAAGAAFSKNICKPAARRVKITFFFHLKKKDWMAVFESNDMNVLKDPAMLKRLNDIQSFPEKEREHILYTLDALIKNAKLKSISE
jgi:hypothetical protein